MITIDELKWIEKWFQSRCDGNWEHMYGVKIETIDNPGWCVHIDLNETGYMDAKMEILTLDNGDDDWIICKIEDGVFEGSGDCSKLSKIIMAFKSFIEP